MATFNFSPERNVPETLPREAPASTMSLNGWQFSARPTTPYQRRFKVTLYGMTWFLNEDGTYDITTEPDFNARLLEIFYEQHETWNPFVFNHQHFGPLNCRFAAPVVVPAAEKNSGGRINSVEILLIAHNPAYGA